MRDGYSIVGIITAIHAGLSDVTVRAVTIGSHMRAHVAVLRLSR